MNRNLLNNAVLGTDYLYYNCNIRYKKGDSSTVASKQFNNTEPILSNPGDYYLAIPRMIIPTRTVQIFDCIPMSPTNPLYIDENTLTFVITIIPVDVPDLTPVTLAVQMETSVVGSTKNRTYYSIYEYSRFIKMINTTLSNIWDIVVLNNTPSILDGTTPPFFNFNASTQLIEYYGESNTAENFELYFNKDLSFYFQGFQSKYTRTDTLLYQRVLAADFNLYRSGNYESFYKVNINGIDYFKFVPDYDILGNWNFLQSIQIFSNLPINREFLDEGKSNEVTKYNSLLKELYVFTEDKNQLTRTNIDYQTDEFDLIEINKGADIIRNFQISVSFKTQTGLTFPLRISEGDAFYLKLMFIKKSYVHSV